MDDRIEVVPLIEGNKVFPYAQDPTPTVIYSNKSSSAAQRVVKIDDASGFQVLPLNSNTGRSSLVY